MNSSDSTTWFCLRSQPKHEHIAARQLALEPDVEVYLPRIRFQRATRQGKMWFTEALFPTYLFARFHLARSLRKINAARGVSGVVHFGDHFPTIPDTVMNELRTTVRDDEICVIDPDVRAGDRVQITDGAFRGLQALVTRVLPGNERVEILLEMLGRQTPLHLSRNAIMGNLDARNLVLPRAEISKNP